MSFQGFTREERFSDNQINIDIQSVINSDFREAERQSKYMSRNSELEQNWRSIYASAKSSKHEAEKRNRERNFKFFMDNREEIHKQIQYNNEIKHKDAGINRHVEGLDSILGKGLLQLATSVGSAAIKKAIAESGEAEAEAEATAKKETIAQAEYIGAVASPEQMKIRQEEGFIETLRKGTAEQIKALHERYAAAGDHRLGVKSGEWAYKISQLDIADRHLNYYSSANVSNAFNESITEKRFDINGADLGLNDVLSGTYDRSTYDAWMEKHRTAFMLERGLNGIHPQAKIKAFNAIRKIENKLTHNVDNNEYKRNLKDREIRWVNHWEHGSENIHQRLTDSFDKNGSGMAAEGVSNEDIWAWKLKHAQNGGMTKGQITEVMSFQPSGLPSINDQGPSEKNPKGTQKYRDWRAALDGEIVREEQAHVNAQAGIDGNLRDIENQITNPQIARTTLQLISPGGELHEKFSAASPKAQNKFLEAVRGTAGYGGEAPTITAGQKAVSTQITDKEAADNARLFVKDKKNGEDVALDGIPTYRMNSLKQSFADAYRYWANGIADELIASGVRPEDVETELNAIIRTDDPRTDSLKKLMQADWYDSDKPDVRLKVPNFPNMIKPRSKDAKGFIQGYDEAYWAAQKEGQRFTLAQADLDHPVVENWVRQVDMAKRYKHIDLQNVLSNPPKEIKHIMRTQKFSTPGQIYQAALDNVEDYGDNYTKLSESDYMDYTEVKQQNDKLGAQFNALQQPVKDTIIAQGGPTLNAAAARTTPGTRHSLGHITYESNPDLYHSFANRIQSMGFTVGGHPLFTAGGTNRHDDPAHSKAGYHPHGEGLDITHQTGDYNKSIEYTRRFKEAMKQLGAVKQVLGPGDAGHSEHTDLGGIRFMPTEEQWNWIENYVFGGNN